MIELHPAVVAATAHVKKPARPLPPDPPGHCRQCDGLGILIGPDFSTTACPCGLWARRTAQRNAAACGIPQKYRDGFATWDDGGSSALAAYARHARAWAERFAPGAPGLLLSGRPGTGKSHLAGAIAWHVVDAGRSGALWWNVCEAMARIRRSFQHGGDDDGAETESEILERAMEADLLVLDDVGAEKSSEFVADRLFLVVNHRLDRGRTTIATTNIALHDLGRRLGDRLASRLHEAAPRANRLLLDAPDFRIAGPRRSDAAVRETREMREWEERGETGDGSGRRRR